MTPRIRAFAARFRTSIAGLSPETIALLFVLGLVLGVFPVYGAPTILCTVVAMAFRLNLPAIQLINQVSSPLQLALLIPLGRAGERILGPGLRGAGHPAVWNLAGAARNAVVGWCCYCLPLGLLSWMILAFVLRRRQTRMNATETTA